MPDWYLAQAGFGEQIQRYGETFLAQMISTLFWTFVVIWIVLLFVAVVITLSQQARVNEEMGSARELDEVLRKTHTGTLARRAGSLRRAGGPAAGHDVIEAGHDVIKAGSPTDHKAA